jgi:hypothetical protein
LLKMCLEEVRKLSLPPQILILFDEGKRTFSFHRGLA